MQKGQPTNADGEGGQGKRRRRKKKVGAGSGTRGPVYSKPPGDNRKLLWIALITLLLLAIIAAAVIAYLSMGSLESRYFEKISCDEEEPTPLHVNSCSKSRCTFDPMTCELACPFGFETDEGPCEISCECATEGIFEGDIQFNEDELPHLSQVYGYSAPDEDFNVFTGSATTGKLWNDSPENGRHTLAYVMLGTVPRKAKSAIKTAIKNYKEQTCIDFVERTNENRYFRFSSQRGCSSIVGKYRKNGQPVSIGKGCEIPGIVQHELKHLLGFFHEHSRPDRDAYIEVMKQNIGKERWNNFKKRLKSQVRSFDSEYDIVSIMHYPSNAFSSNGKPAILKRDTQGRIRAQRKAFTKDDLLEINSLYDCEEYIEGARYTQWSEWAMCDETCGVGERSRFRKCRDGDRPAKGCTGPKFQKLICTNAACPKKSGKWGKWEKFGECSQSCAGGYHWRRRRCPSECDGSSSQGKSCNTITCEDTPAWAEWTQWSVCSKRCEGGKKKRKQQCYIGGNVPALTCDEGDGSGVRRESQSCNTQTCGAPPSDADWGLWSSCSSSCSGTRTRKRVCRKEGCSGEEKETAACNEGVCGKGPSMFEVNVVNAPEKLCDRRARHSWYFGDYNGDKHTDALCGDAAGTFKLGHTSTSGTIEDVRWSGKLRDCSGKEIFVGDFNGDKKEDLLCRDKNAKKLTIKLASSYGTFTDGSVNTATFCIGQTDEMIIMDANGDGKMDIACYYGDKRIEVRLNQHD